MFATINKLRISYHLYMNTAAPESAVDSAGLKAAARHALAALRLANPGTNEALQALGRCQYFQHSFTPEQLNQACRLAEKHGASDIVRELANSRSGR